MVRNNIPLEAVRFLDEFTIASLGCCFRNIAFIQFDTIVVENVPVQFTNLVRWVLNVVTWKLVFTKCRTSL